MLNRFSIFMIIILGFSPEFLEASSSDSDDEIAALSKSFKSKAKVSKPVTLCRLDEEERVVALYVDEIGLIDKWLPLNRSTPQKRALESANLWSQDGYKSHVRVGSLCAYEDREGDEIIQTPLLKTDLDFPSLIKDRPKAPLIIDWASIHSSTGNTDQIYCVKSKIGNGHSEAQLISDINALWKTQPDSIVQSFIPSRKSKAVAGTGFELYGSLDACDQCLQSLVDFRETHQRGQQSISHAIRDRLEQRKIPFKGDKEDAFLLIYHAHYPYRDSTYHGQEGTSYSKLDYSYKPNPREDIFGSSKFEDTHTLSHSASRSHKNWAEKGKIYSHIHSLSGREARHKDKAFVFK